MKQRFPPRFTSFGARTAPAAAAPTRMRRKSRAVVSVGLCVLLVHTAAQAQQPATPPDPEPVPAPAQPQTPPAPAQQPRMPPPPPNYPPPPPGYPPATPYGAPPGYPQPGPGYYPQSYYPAQPQRSTYRPFTLGLGLGIGTLSFRDEFGTREGEPGLSYTLRVGFGITRSWLVFVGAEGIGVNHVDAGVWQTAYLIGAQCFVFHRLYLRAGFGLATATVQDHQITGQSLMGAAGFEFAQGYSTSLAVELSFTGARYPRETWANGGLNFVLSFF